MKNFNTIADLKVMVVDELERLSKAKPVPRQAGICFILQTAFDNAFYGIDLVKHTCVGWEHHSGCNMHPVPSRDAEVSYTSWDGTTTEGKLRRDLCAYLAEHIKNLSVNEFANILQRRY